ncbi:hypothetical protein TALK_09105 [Thalassospira alkalitolerans]|uniref:Phosphoenolpyruvate synthase n=2 Tax=Thalassospira alkalitolerans TaxID=1293890 RepID=A0A1Y2LEJ8_9PROT|nr:hypothetical protein TALK_09105 [Thalassospira alkalitolerans]
MHISSENLVIQGSKAEVLQQLRSVATTFEVLPVYKLKGNRWQETPQDCIDEILVDKKLIRPLIVRSSFSNEDSATESHAGEFESVLNVSTEEGLRTAITSVFASYSSSIEHEHVLIQPMAKGVAISGVLMTADPHSGAPYTIINFVEGTNTEAVTSGQGEVKSVVFLNGCVSLLPLALKPLRDPIVELTALMGHRPIDVEFAITTSGKVIIFQSRPIVFGSLTFQLKNHNFDAIVENARERYKNFVKYNNSKSIDGSTLGVMPDWNPAELIGSKPRPLAYSLYRYLITDGPWAKGRAQLGYHDMRDHSLMTLIGGVPFISVGTSFNSFIPKSVSASVRKKIVNDANAALRISPSHHDKVEFKIIPTIYKPEMHRGEWRDRFPSLTDAEWESYLSSLLDLTNNIVDEHGNYFRLMKRIEYVEAIYEENIDLSSAELIEVKSILNKVRQVATPLFSAAARAAFVATDILKSLQGLGYISAGLIEVISKSANAIGAQMVDDYRELDASKFLEKYGHIRPGTFDITAPRYDSPDASYFSAFDFDKNLDTDPNRTNNDEVMTTENINNINSFFSEVGYQFNWEKFQSFAETSINYREKIKYLYTKKVSDVLEIIKNIGSRYGHDVEVMSFMTISDIENMLDLGFDPHHRIAEISVSNKIIWQKNLPVRLPDLLTDFDDVYCFTIMDSIPNYITGKTVEANVAEIGDGNLAGKIIFIESADPGFDWIFTHPIAGFITKYGGENSHMAIRSREFGVPAVIGAGNYFDKWRKAHRLRVECTAKRVEVIL